MLKQFAVGTFSSYETTEIALRELKNSPFPMDRVSLVGPDINTHTENTGANISNPLVNFGDLDTNENQAGAMMGMTLGSFAGLLVGLGAIAIPGVGPIILAGAAATALISTLSGGVIGGLAGGLAGGLIDLGIPADRSLYLSDRITDGDYLVMVEGSQADITKAQSIFSKYNIHDWHVYDSPKEPLKTITKTTVPLMV